MRRATDFRTVLYLATEGSSATSPSACVTATWANFSDSGEPADVCAWDDTAKDYSRSLDYYQNSTGHGNTTTAELLDEQDGTCDAWADFLNECFLANNISGSAIATADEPHQPEPLEAFGVANIDFDDADPEYDQSWDPWRYGWGDLYTSSVVGIPGQNMATPQAKLFNYHRLVKVGSVFYDPSYGDTIQDNAAAKQTYTDESVDAWLRQLWHDPPGDYYDHWRKAQVGDTPLVFTP